MMYKNTNTDDFYCPKCSNLGVLADGVTPCDCKLNLGSFYSSVACMEIPEQYRGVLFNAALLPRDLDESYANYMAKLHADVVSMKVRNKNICICSPIAHGKTVLAYSCIEGLFQHNIEAFPLLDVLELKHLTLDMDLGRKLSMEIENPERMYTAPYLFVKIPRMSNWEVFDAITMIIDRRTRRGNTTILLYDGTWEHLTAFDKQGTLLSMMGDGSYNTIKVHSWYVQNKQEVPIQIQDNLG